MPFDDIGRLTFQRERRDTRVYHSFPPRFPPVYVNGAVLQRDSKSQSLGNVATLRIGEDIKIIYGDNASAGSATTRA